MIRNLKFILISALAVTAFGAFASAAHAVKEFTAPGALAGQTTHLDVVQDGSGKTAHHVFIVGNAAGSSTVSFTCEKVEGTPHIIGDTALAIELITPGYSGCTASGQAVKVTNTGCNFNFTASGEVHVVNETGKVCKHGAGNAPIDIEFAGCKVEVGAQPLKGIGYHNLSEAGATVGSNNEGHKVTLEAAVAGITYNAVGAACNYGTTSNGTYTTGNTIITGTRPAGTTVPVRWDSP